MITAGEMVQQIFVQLAVLTVGSVLGGIVIGFLLYPRLFRRGRHAAKPSHSRAPVERRHRQREVAPLTRSWESRGRW
ncbi:hypothetical protein E1287_31285 [Actinomadura sp. KC06]|uniref:hypothetical protein n=1 Tax=Actinomadura sp. KC06 TaxID=2530369 RepID=UPI00104870F2|nr:hypothetical protein [Actinomadura sp. KC06]TDD29289.1 hypothetical protein E1287_31285 [Actinomadura sp. KC06]